MASLKIIFDTLIIYISNTGFNGHGCIMATELLLALMRNNILNSETHWLLYQNYETDEIYRNLIDSMSEYRINNELLIKLHKHVKEHRQKMNLMIDSLESEVFQLSMNTQQTFSKVIGLVDQIKLVRYVHKNTTTTLDDIKLPESNIIFYLLKNEFEI